MNMQSPQSQRGAQVPDPGAEQIADSVADFRPPFHVLLFHFSLRLHTMESSEVTGGSVLGFSRA